MILSKVHTNIRFQVDKLSTGAIPALTKEGIDLQINDSTEGFIKERYRPIVELLYRKEGFEQIQKRIDDLRTLVTTKEIVVGVAEFGELQADLTTVPNEVPYQHYLRSSVKLSNGSFARIQIIKHDNIEVIKNDPFNKSTSKIVKAYFEGNLLKILPTTKGLAISDKLRLTYLRRFIEVDITANTPLKIDLPEHTHREIIKMCVNDILEIVESRRVQSQKEKVQQVE